MDAFELLKQDLMNGRIDAQAVLSFVIHLQQQLQTANQQLQTANQELQAARERIAELEQKQSPPASSPTAKVDEAYSMRAEEKRQQQKNPKKKAKVKPSRKSRHGRKASGRDEPRLSSATSEWWRKGTWAGQRRWLTLR